MELDLDGSCVCKENFHDLGGGQGCECRSYLNLEDVDGACKCKANFQSVVGGACECQTSSNFELVLDTCNCKLNFTLQLGSCVCVENFRLSGDATQCLCEATHNLAFDSSDGSCVCMEGFQPQDNGECVFGKNQSFCYCGDYLVEGSCIPCTGDGYCPCDNEEDLFNITDCPEWAHVNDASSNHSYRSLDACKCDAGRFMDAETGARRVPIGGRTLASTDNVL
eukprot:70043-Rhodomonas_salina.1